MLYTDQTRRAMKLCFEAHRDQTDRSGLPYVFHPFHLAEQMPDEVTTITALLHDVVEDTDYTMAELLAMGFPTQSLEAVRLKLTVRKRSNGETVSFAAVFGRPMLGKLFETLMSRAAPFLRVFAERFTVFADEARGIKLRASLTGPREEARVLGERLAETMLREAR